MAGPVAPQHAQTNAPKLPILSAQRANPPLARRPPGHALPDSSNHPAVTPGRVAALTQAGFSTLAGVLQPQKMAAKYWAIPMQNQAQKGTIDPLFFPTVGSC